MKKYKNKRILEYILLILGIVLLAIILKQFSNQKFYEKTHYPRFLDKKEVSVGFGSVSDSGIYDEDYLVELKDFQITEENDYYFTIYTQKPIESSEDISYEADFGHSFISLSSISQTKPITETAVVLGFYPEAKITMKDIIIGTEVKGTFKNDNFHNYSNQHSFKLPAEEMERMKKTLEQIQMDVETGKIKYNAEKYNSSTMIAKVIEQFNLGDFNLNEQTWGYKTDEIITFKQKKVFNKYNKYLKNKKGYIAWQTDGEVEDYTKKYPNGEFNLRDFLRALE